MDVLDLTIDDIKYPHFQLSERLDLRPALHRNWKILKGYPRMSTQQEREILASNIQDETIQVYRYISPESDETITQLFTLDHKYVGGSTHFRLVDEVTMLSEADLNRICNVTQF